MKTTNTNAEINHVRFYGVNDKDLNEDTIRVIDNPSPKIDKFEKSSSKKTARSQFKYRKIMNDARALWGKPPRDNYKVPWPNWEAVSLEEEFIKHPNFDGFLKIEHQFNDTMMTVGHSKYLWNEDIKVRTSKGEDESLMPMPFETKKFAALEKWHQKTEKTFLEGEFTAYKKTKKRHDKLEEKGPGFGGKMTRVIEKTKGVSFFVKNNLTIRGNVFKITHQVCPKNIYEIMPRYGYRKGAHVGVRISQFTLNTILSAIGYAFTPVTFGVSKYVTNHLSTVVTLTGECFTHKIAGADKKKVVTHGTLRGVQLTIPRAIPIIGNVVNIGENVVFGTAAFGIVSTTIADWILQATSARYRATINLDDLGDSRCLKELNRRIDYLSTFLLPYGQYLLLNEVNMEKRVKLKAILKKQFKTLRILEKNKVQSLNFYRLALAAEKIPESHREMVKSDCVSVLPERRINTHNMVRKCLAVLIQEERVQKTIPAIKEIPLMNKSVKPLQLLRV